MPSLEIAAPASLIQVKAESGLRAYRAGIGAGPPKRGPVSGMCNGSTTMKTGAIFGAILLGLALTGGATRAQDVVHGEADYKLCAGCHGFKGEGNALVNAPALAGQQGWYLARQIQNFRTGIRGSAATDVHGSKMATMSQGIRSDEQVADLVAYIGTLPVASPASTVSGDPENGRQQFAPCAACHGNNAEGNPTLNAPALATVDDWYQLAQLQAFRDGTRGAHPDDVYGQQMRPMAGVLAGDKAMRDVVAYIASLK
jgi:cytochrome c oxidase subunit II